MPRKLIGVLQTSGMQGPPGPEGKPGPEGVAGKGFPVGGLANQILAKKSDADYDTEWIDNNAKGNVESVNGKTGKVTLTAEDVGATTEQWVESQNYLTEHQDISNLATKAEVSELENKIPTKVSQLENDKGYLTEHQDLTGYAKKTDIPDVSGFITEIPAEYVTDDELNAKGYLTEHQSLANYYTKPEVNELIPDLSGYALKTEIPTVPTNVSAFNNDVGYLTEIPSEYVTETELESKGYLTEHQSLANYSTTEEMNNAISNHHDSTKQDTLTAGSNITIENNVISATGGGSSNNDVFTFKSPTYYINNPDAEDTKEFYRVMQNLNLYKRYQILSTDLKLYPSTREYYVDILNIIKWNDEYHNGNTNITIQFNYLNAKSTNTIYIQQRAYSFTSTDYTLLNSSGNNDWNFNITGDDGNRYVIKSQLSTYVNGRVQPWIRADNTSDSSLYYATEIAIMYNENDMWICHYYNYRYYGSWSSDSTLGNYGNQNQYFPTPQHPNGYWIYNGSDITFYNGIEDKIAAGYMHIYYRSRELD